jgi:hypothetical protein
MAQHIALALTGLWLVALAVRFRRSRIAVLGGLVMIAMFALWAVIAGDAHTDEFGLGTPVPWTSTIAFALAGLAITIAWSPLADRIASRMVSAPPTLGTFRALQESKLKLAAGIVLAWALGACLEEFVFRGVVVSAVAGLTRGPLGAPLASIVAIAVAAAGAGLIHAYQGPRAMIIIAQISVLFGLVFVASGYNLCAAILCHGLYDTIAFVRFAAGASKYSKLGAGGSRGDAETEARR